MTAPGPGARRLRLDAPVVEVTVFEDRARVVRRGRARLESGRVVVEVDGVAPVLSDRSLTVSVERGPDGARVLDSRTRRRLVVRRSDSKGRGEDRGDDLLSRLEADGERLDSAIDDLEASSRRLQEEMTALDLAAGQCLVEIGEDVAWGRVEPDDWASRLDQLRARAHAAMVQLDQERRKLEDRRRERQRIEQRMAALKRPDREQWAGIEAELGVERAGEFELCFEYLVPGACWRPVHRARLQGGEGPQVDWQTEGCVWQRTGEDWTDVELVFSTLRPSLGTEPPRLESDLLSVQDRAEELVVESRDQEVTTTGLGREELASSQELPGIDDGGQPVTLRALRRASVPSDGRPCRVPLFEFLSPAEVGLVSRPELAAAVLLESVLVNRAEAPILAGPVELIRDGGPTGRTSVLAIAPGERFRLGWGPEPELRVQRQVEEVRDKKRALSSWEKHHHRAVVRLSNLGSQERRVRVTERVPVSEIGKVKVSQEVAETTEGARSDRDGFVDWQVRLQPFDQHTLTLAYTLEKHQDVVGI